MAADSRSRRRSPRPRGRRRSRGALTLALFALMAVAVAFGALGPEPATPSDAQAAERGSSDLTGVARVIDGDTLDVAGARVRLHGIDAPEANQTCAAPDGEERRAGAYAERALVELAEGRLISCAVREIDRYGRAVATCAAGDRDLSSALVREGWAFAYARYSTDYVPQEQLARSERRGLWAWSCEAPWAHRRGGSA